MSEPSAGEVGGLFAGAVALLVAIGHGLRWLLGWEERRDQARRDRLDASERTRSAKLDAWQVELGAREARVDAEMAAQHREMTNEFKALKALDERRTREYAALHTAYQLVHTRLRLCDPADPALGMADELLRIAFPPDPDLPVEFGQLVKRIDAVSPPIRREDKES